MKKYFVSLLLLTILFSFSTITITQADTMTVSQLIELLITSGAIPADKAVAARAVGVSLDVSRPATTTTTTSSGASYLQVILPKLTETWLTDQGMYHPIVWGSTGISSARVALVSSSTKATKTASSTVGVNCDLTSSPIISKNGDNTLKVTTPVICYDNYGGNKVLVDGTYRVKITGTDISGKEIKAEGGTVKIISPVLKVTYPNGGEILSHSNYTLKYTLTNASTKKLEAKLLNYQGDIIPLVLKSSVVRAATSRASSTLSHSFKIPSSVEAGAYKLKLDLMTTNSNRVEDSSDDFFWISDSL